MIEGSSCTSHDRVEGKEKKKKKKKKKKRIPAAYLSLDILPLLIDAFRQQPPHLLAYFGVGFGQLLDLPAVPGIGTVALLHQAFVSFATGIGSLVGEVCRCNGLPVEAFLARVHQLIVIGGIPRAGGMALDRGRGGSGHCCCSS